VLLGQRLLGDPAHPHLDVLTRHRYPAAPKRWYAVRNFATSASPPSTMAILTRAIARSSCHGSAALAWHRQERTDGVFAEHRPDVERRHTRRCSRDTLVHGAGAVNAHWELQLPQSTASQRPVKEPVDADRWFCSNPGCRA
jgi:hypothetical protein